MKNKTQTSALNMQRSFRPFWSKAISNVYQYLTSHSNLSRAVMVMPYHWPDLDGIASAYSLDQLLKKKGYTNVRSRISKKPQDEAQWVMTKLGINIPQIDFKGDEELILVDASDPKDIPSFLPLDQFSVVIDHRNYHDLLPFTKAIIWIEPVGSAATLISQLYSKACLLPDPICAKLLYLAIMSNTIKCQSHNTTPQDRAAAKWLSQIGEIDERFVNEMFIAKSKAITSEIRNIKKKIDDDLSSKLSLINGKQTAVALLEITNVSDFLSTNKREILQALSELKKERSAEAIFFMAIDIMQFKTYFCFIDKATENFLTSKTNIEKIENDYYVLNDILTRKEAISLLSEAKVNHTIKGKL